MKDNPLSAIIISVKSSPITILLADDHAVVREGIREIIERSPDMEVVGEAGDGEQAVDIASRTLPEVALLDIKLPGITGIDAARQIAKVSPKTKVLILSAYAERAYIEAAMEAGVHGYLLKSAPGRVLLDSIRAVRSGAMVLDSSLPRGPIGHSLDTLPSSSEAPTLTPREIEIVALVTKGYRNKQIAMELGVSLRTVESHLEHVFDKVGSTSRTELSMYAVAHGWVDPSAD
ncbi:MAG: response regulator transcription factor [Actinobacteria bacterium]|jgi:DNA-binding NarL/FixJ family response regulator|nr:response regulator transcription factor [Actinomycetota bacterium]MCL5885586.1 response regulator transcription factor [Actinomycetota bacterium]